MKIQGLDLYFHKKFKKILYFEYLGQLNCYTSGISNLFLALYAKIESISKSIHSA